MERLVACHDCDLLQRIPPIPVGGAARCPRCNAVLARVPHNSLERTAALAIAALFLFVGANVFPLLTLDISGRLTDASIITGTHTLWVQGSRGVAALVFLTAVAAPLMHILMLLYVVVPLWLSIRPPYGVRVFRFLQRIRPWSMAEVFMLGVLVSMVKLADLAEIVPGIALWSFTLLIPILTATMVTLDDHLTWERLAPESRFH